MLTTLLQNLQALVSRGFVVAFFIPSLAFAFCNGGMLYWHSRSFRNWVVGLLTGGTAWPSVWSGATTLVVIALVAYAVSALSGRLRGLLEGRWGARILLRGQFEARDRLVHQCEAVLGIRDELERRSIDDPQAQWLAWSRRLREARALGAAAAANTFSFRGEPAAKKIVAIRKQRRTGHLIHHADVEAAVLALEGELRASNANVAYLKKGKDKGRTLDAAQRELNNLIAYALEFARAEHARLVTKFQFDFGGQPTITGHPAAPTAMGNVAASVHAYAETRYNLNLDIFWSRLQKAVRKDEGSFTAMQDAKSQLDFFVVSSWFTGAFTALWTTALLVAGYDWVVFLCVALGGPVATYLWYRIAVEQYRAFSDLLRASVDLFRFDLLADLRIAPPADLDDEKYLWDELNRLTTLGEGDAVFRYQHPKSPS